MRVTMWDPFKEFEDLQHKINRMFETPRRKASCGYLPIDLIDAGDKLIILALLPGMKREDIDVSVFRDEITLSGERKREVIEEARCIRRERGYGAFQKVIELPEPIQVDEINAEYKDGVLNIIMPKERFSEPITIPID